MQLSNNDRIATSLLFTGIAQLPGVGATRADYYKKLGIHNVRDLILYMPTRVLERKMMPDLKDIKDGDHISQLVTINEIHFASSRRSPSKVVCGCNGGYLEIVYFNMPRQFVENTFQIGKQLIVVGAANVNYGMVTIPHPDAVLAANDLFKVRQFEPIYPASRGLTSKFIGITIRKALQKIPEISEWILPEIMQQKNWLSFRKALEVIHNPKSQKDVEQASYVKARLAFDEIFAHQIKLRELRSKVKAKKSRAIEFTGDLKQQMLAQLPFELTDAQKKVLSELEYDFKSDTRTSRLIQGDVGAGKTVVALSAILDIIESGGQAALMVPTEILSVQHHNSINKMIDGIGIKAVLLLGSMTPKQKKEAYASIESGESHIVIGTHALFQEKANYKNLRLVVVDEQHRFGVDQRKALMLKGSEVEFIMMTATPIPRTLEMVNFGDMDVSVIAQKPANRKEIITSVMSHKKIVELEDSLAHMIETGEKIYWICPLIEETEKMDLANVTERFESLSGKFQGKVAIMHGKTKIAEREETMRKFIAGDIKIVVATTVIEVGVDVKDATVMIIENAERFGLSQLHQLRGRVGRGEKQSYCILIYGENFGAVSRERLGVMKSSNDGFYIAEQDLLIRGSGDVVGKKQSGLPSFRVFDIEVDSELLKLANKYSSANMGESLLMSIFPGVLEDAGNV